MMPLQEPKIKTERDKSTMEKRIYEAYLKRHLYAENSMSHTVTSRELVRQVPLISPDIRAASLGNFIP